MRIFPNIVIAITIVLMITSCQTSGHFLEQSTIAYDNGEFQEALNIVDDEAKAGNVSAQYKLAKMYKDGILTNILSDHYQPNDEIEDSEMPFIYTSIRENNLSHLWYSVAALNGHKGAKSELEQNRDQVYENMLKFTLYNVGVIYETGAGLPQSYESAVRYYNRAIKINHNSAIPRLAKLYEKGWGVPQDYKIARKLYKKYMDEWGSQGDVEYRLGLLYEKGLGGKVDLSKARVLYVSAAEDGTKEVFLRMWDFYKNGIGVEKNLITAYMWLELAREWGNFDDQEYLNSEEYGLLQNIKIDLNTDEIIRVKERTKNWYNECVKGNMC